MFDLQVSHEWDRLTHLYHIDILTANIIDNILDIAIGRLMLGNMSDVPLCLGRVADTHTPEHKGIFYGRVLETNTWV